MPTKVTALNADKQARQEAERAQVMLDAWIFPNGEGHPLDAHAWRRRVWLRRWRSAARRARSPIPAASRTSGRPLVLRWDPAHNRLAEPYLEVTGMDTAEVATALTSAGDSAQRLPG